MKCYLCKKELKKGNTKHIYYCAKNKNINDSRSNIFYNHLCFNYNKNFNRKELEELYNFESLLEISTIWKVDYHHLVFLLDFFKIPRRNIKESNSHPSRQNKTKKTCLKKYGVENPSQIEEIKEKKKNTFVKNYGVDNIFKSKEFIKNLPIIMNKKYGKGSLSNRYGGINKYWDNVSIEEKKKIGKKLRKAYENYLDNLTEEELFELNRKKGSRFVEISLFSKIEKRIFNLLKELNIEFEHQFWIAQKSFDFRIKNTMQVIEVQGDFWHGNPLIYKSGDIINYPSGKIIVDQLWEKDRNKKLIAEKYGYNLNYLWEQQINNLSDEELKNILIEIKEKK